jgi:hypothetical protein
MQLVLEVLRLWREAIQRLLWVLPLLQVAAALLLWLLMRVAQEVLHQTAT